MAEPWRGLASSRAASRYRSRGEESSRHLKLLSLLPALLCGDERMSSTTEESGKPCTSLARRSDTHLLGGLSLLEQCKGPS